MNYYNINSFFNTLTLDKCKEIINKNQINKNNLTYTGENDYKVPALFKCNRIIICQMSENDYVNRCLEKNQSDEAITKLYNNKYRPEKIENIKVLFYNDKSPAYQNPELKNNKQNSNSEDDEQNPDSEDDEQNPDSEDDEQNI
jgi:hypothetical protein